MLNAWSNRLGFPSPKSLRQRRVLKSQSADSCTGTGSPPDSPTLADTSGDHTDGATPQLPGVVVTKVMISSASPAKVKRELLSQFSMEEGLSDTLKPPQEQPPRRSASWKGFQRPRSRTKSADARGGGRRVTSFTLSRVRSASPRPRTPDTISPLSPLGARANVAFVMAAGLVEKNADFEVKLCSYSHGKRRICFSFAIL